MVVYALLGSSRVLSVSSTTTLAILAGTQLGLAVPDGDQVKLVTATATLTALVGAMLLLARLMRLGFVANFIFAPVLTGFKAGIGLVIVLDQVPKLMGIHITKQGFFFDLLSGPDQRRSRTHWNISPAAIWRPISRTSRQTNPLAGMNRVQMRDRPAVTEY